MVEVYSWDTIAQLNEPTCDVRPGSTDAMCLTRNTTLGMEFNSFNEASIKNKVESAPIVCAKWCVFHNMIWFCPCRL